MYSSSSVSPKMVVAVIFVAMIIIVMMFVFRRHGCDPLSMTTSSLQPSGAVKNAWINLVNYKLPATQKKVTRVHPRKQGDKIVSLEEAIKICKSGGYCERVQTDGDNYIFVNWPSFSAPCQPCTCPATQPCTCPATQPCTCPVTLPCSACPPSEGLKLAFYQNCNVDDKTGLPFWKEQYRGGHYSPSVYDTNGYQYNNGFQYNNGILPYNPRTGFTLYPYNPYTGDILIDAITGLPVKIDDLGLARFSSDTSQWYNMVYVDDIALAPCSVGSRTGLPDNIFRDAEKSNAEEGLYYSGPGLPIKRMDLNGDGSLKPEFDKSKVQRFNEDVNNLPKHPKTRLPLYPYNPYTGKAIIDPNTGKPVAINAADGLAKF